MDLLAEEQPFACLYGQTLLTLNIVRTAVYFQQRLAT